ncbi:MAG TPA: hypothetical protein VGL94_10380 [Ktedonobacteraceae bacterium]|jgi:serine/threonine protein kinase
MHINTTILHGNIKPENILFNANDQALLTDFTLMNSTDAMIRDQKPLKRWTPPSIFTPTRSACQEGKKGKEIMNMVYCYQDTIVEVHKVTP